MANLLILPWLRLKQSYHTDEIQLIRWTPGAALPGLDGDNIARVLAILGMYRDLQGKPIQQATLACLGGKGLLDNLTDAELQDAFDLVELVAFSALANREYFGSLGNYCNRECFDMISQRFDGAKHVALVPRRRVGRAMCGWGTDNIAITTPVQCHYLEEFVLDEVLLKALTALRKKSPAQEWAKWQSSVACFNWGNTDSETVRWQTEWVLMCGAFQRLLGEWRAARLEKRFLAAFQPEQVIPWGAAPRSADHIRTQKDEMEVRGYWIEEFCNQRGDLAHGRVATTGPATWEPWEHLLLAAIAFPLLAKQILHQAECYQLTDDDRARINVFEAFAGAKSLMMSEEDAEHYGDSVWRRLMNPEYGRLRGLRFEERCRTEFPEQFGGA